MRLSKFTLIFSIYIIISSYFMQDVWTAWKSVFGRNRLTLFFVLMCLAAISAIIHKSVKSKINLKGILLVFIICIGGFIFALRQPYLPEKAHVLEFALLGWLVMRDLTKENRNLIAHSFMAFVFAAIIGCLEEGFQKFLPWRVFEVRDIITDVLSGAIGIILFNLTQARLSAFIRPF